jgi:hypothetical protein
VGQYPDLYIWVKAPWATVIVENDVPGEMVRVEEFD